MVLANRVLSRTMSPSSTSGPQKIENSLLGIELQLGAMLTWALENETENCCG